MTDRDASMREAQRLEDAHGSGDPYAAALRATRMPIVITDATQDDNPIVFANDAFVQLVGYDRDEIIGRNCRFLQGPETSRRDIERIADAIGRRDNVVAEILNYRKDGTTFWNALYISPVFGLGGEVTHFFGSQLDVTEKNRSAAALADANARLAEAKAMAEALVEERTHALRVALEQKTVLLHEVDHRVKNNLQLVASLILLQSRRIPDPEIRATLKSMLDRVTALATVHRKLYQSDDVALFDVSDFIHDIASDLVGAAGRDDIRLEFDLEPVLIPAQRAAPVALVVNELLTNALKHAFPLDRAGRIKLTSRKLGRDFIIGVEDDGIGRVVPNGAAGFGQSLIDMLSRQLSAKLERSDVSPGIRVIVTLPVDPASRGRDDIG